MTDADSETKRRLDLWHTISKERLDDLASCSFSFSTCRKFDTAANS